MSAQLTDLDKTMTKIRTTRGLSAEVAKACGVHRAAVYQWKRVPPQWVNTVSKVLGITPERIRPDIFKRRRA
jgi:Putative antitoxin of bacterial toxin-antitoxin system, YdaS/YdaT